ncbi:LOW QUALITY PROTEIN: uncharacterized protein LOC114878370 [Osmia bicornis bicornis]|uniref:LOW QUALITY PROTEIN: uncharacterized protein LOC114878370 n=1 Tax=Osmia bicornis bicornis TaxID=1437191 RepID=UPI001EAEA077|nr:LOW QUALITY PROTEIN: uncharacterized protein LOC114878370 [Osmia bicornis bicornis]
MALIEKKIQKPKRSSRIRIKNLNQIWNGVQKDKKILLEALKKYGSEDISALSRMLPNISPKNIKSKISEYSQMAEGEVELLNKWLKCGLYEARDSLIPEALLFIQLFEDHPPPSESGYDFRAIYNFLYRSCVEEPPFFDLSSNDTDILYSLLSKIEEKSWPKHQKHLWEYVGRIYNKRNIKEYIQGRTYVLYTIISLVNVNDFEVNNLYYKH